ncbi:MAG: lipopolysaccharide kinase InaA family protein [Ktedonobacteraceae bacterium]
MLNDADLRWPTRDDYRFAIEDYPKNILDASLLRQGKPKSMNTHILNFGHPDSHACIYRIGNTMIRCFCQADDHTYPPNDIFKRYKSLEQFLAQNQSTLSAFIPVKYVPRGIRVNFFDKITETHFKTTDMPLVTMEYVSGYSLNTYIAESCQANGQQVSRKLLSLCDAWTRMIHEMEEARIAHGDLDLSNVFVQEDVVKQNIHLKLIDYDNTWIPEFERDYPLPEYGHGPFQHPAFYDTPNAIFNKEIDRFAALVIYISIKALALRPSLYKDFGVDDHRLLFTPENYEDEQKSKPTRIRELKALRLDGLDDYIEELLNSLLENRMPASLDTIAAGQISRPPVILTSQEPASPLQAIAQQDLRSAVVLPEGYREVIDIDWNDLRPRKETPLQKPPRVSPAPTSAQQYPQQQQQLPAQQPMRAAPVPAPINAQPQPAAQQPEPAHELYQEQMPYQGPRPMPDKVRQNRITSQDNPNWRHPKPKADLMREQELAKSAGRQGPPTTAASQSSANASPSPAGEQLDSAPLSYRYEPGNFTGHNESTEEITPRRQSSSPTNKVPSRQLSSPNYMMIGGIIVALALIIILLVIYFVIRSHTGASHPQMPYQQLSLFAHTPPHLTTGSFTSIFYSHKGIAL